MGINPKKLICMSTYTKFALRNNRDENRPCYHNEIPGFGGQQAHGRYYILVVSL